MLGSVGVVNTQKTRLIRNQRRMFYKFFYSSSNLSAEKLRNKRINLSVSFL